MRKLVTFSALALILGACAKETPSPEPAMHEQAPAAASPAAPPARPTPAPPAPPPPVAKKLPHERTLHGETFVDDYFWLREKDHPEVLAHLAAEEAHADALMARFKPLMDQLFDEIVSHIAEDDESTPAKLGAHVYWRKVEKGKNYPIHLRRPADGGPAESVLDVNALAEGKEFMGIGEFEPSDDGRLLLYSTDETGFRQYTLRVKDLTTGEDLPETFEKVVSSSWASDGKTLFYVVEDHAKRPHRLYRHTLGTPVSEDALVYEEADQRFELHVKRSKSTRFVIAHTESKLASEVRLIPADTPDTAPILVLARAGEHEYHVEHHGDWLIIRTNDHGKNFRLVKAPLANPSDRSLWVELRPHDPEVMLERHLVLSSAIALETRQGGLPHLEVARLSPETQLAPAPPSAPAWDRIALPDPVYGVNLDPAGNLEFQTNRIRYVYQSLATPRTTFEYDLATKTSTRLKEDPVPGGFDRTRYLTERVFARSHDGVEVPISLVRRADLAVGTTAPARPHPLHLVGYGSYGYSYPVTFSPARLTLLDRGVILAIAHIRGGGELGKRWHEEGRLAKKMNTFHDFIAAAEHLVQAGYTSPSRLSIEGGSAGGLLMGAVVNLRPDLFHAVISQVPFVDVVNTMNDPTLPLTVTEYEEWGNPNLPDQYAWIRAYSPYDNLEAKRYPHMLVKTSYNDSQVMYWEPAKYVARLRALKTDDHVLMFKINLGAAGHGGKSGRYDRFREVAFDQAFLLWKHGLAD